MGMTVSLIAAMYSHFYSVLLILPIGVGEIVRSIVNRRSDLRIWLSLAFTACTATLLLPLIKSTHEYAAHFWSLPRLYSIPESYEILLTPILFPAVAVMAVICVYRMLERHGFILKVDNQQSESPPIHEIAAALTLTGMPFLVGALAATVTHAFVPTYPIAMVIGIGILVGFGSSHNRGDHILFAVSAVLFLSVLFLGKQIFYDVAFVFQPQHAWESPYRSTKITSAQFKTLSLPSIPGADQTPIAVADANLFHQLSFYAPTDIRSRVVYLTDRAAAVAYEGFDTDEITFQGLRRWTTINVQDYHLFIEKHVRFLLLGDGWITQQLLTDNAHLQLVGRTADKFIYVVTFK
jgi:hypothetical protein